MNCTVEEAEAFFKHFKLQKKEGVEMLICPPFTDLPLTNFFLARTSVHWGAQNVYPEEKGAFTGEIAPAMLKGLGCSYVICGHSERREILGESDEFIARKVKAVKEHGMTPILCVGETAEERKNGQTEERIAVHFGASIRRMWALLSSPMSLSGLSAAEQLRQPKMLKRSVPSSVRR